MAADAATRSRIADVGLAPEGDRLIGWAQQHMPVLAELGRGRLADGSLHRPQGRGGRAPRGEDRLPRARTCRSRGRGRRRGAATHCRRRTRSVPHSCVAGSRCTGRTGARPHEWSPTSLPSPTPAPSSIVDDGAGAHPAQPSSTARTSTRGSPASPRRRPPVSTACARSRRPGDFRSQRSPRTTPVQAPVRQRLRDGPVDARRPACAHEHRRCRAASAASSATAWSGAALPEARRRAGRPRHRRRGGPGPGRSSPTWTAIDVAPLRHALPDADVVLTATGLVEDSSAKPTWRCLKDGVLLANAGHSDREIDVTAIAARPRTSRTRAPVS